MRRGSVLALSISWNGIQRLFSFNLNATNDLLLPTLAAIASSERPLNDKCKNARASSRGSISFL